jgi:hypothetical protein
MTSETRTMHPRERAIAEAKTPLEVSEQLFAVMKEVRAGTLPVKDAERINAIASKVITRLEEEARQAGLLRRKRG